VDNQNWRKQVFNLPENHGWTAKPGNKVFVADRGALRFEIPQEWLVEPSRKSIKFRDAEHPDDTMILEVTVFYAGALGVPIDWSDLPLSELIKDVTDENRSIPKDRASRGRKHKDASKVGTPLTIKLGNLEMAWVQTEFIDPGEKRLAYSRTAITRDPKASIHAVLTFSYWPEDADRATAVWNDVMGTLKMGEHFDSLFRGPEYEAP
jgi:hypothetical protein